MDEFVAKLEQIALPAQMAAVLGNRLLQRYIRLIPAISVLQRLDNWLEAILEGQLQQDVSKSSTGDRFLSMLEALLAYVRFTKVGVPCIPKVGSSSA